MGAFTLETVSSIQKDALKLVFSQLEISNNKHSKCYKSGVSENIVKSYYKFHATL